MKLHLPKNQRVMRDLTSIGLPEVPLFGAFSATQAETALPMHTHGDCMEIHYFKSGHQIFMVGGKIYNVKGGDLFVTFPDEPHGTANYPLRGIIYWMQIRIPAGNKKGSFLGLSNSTSARLITELKSLKVRHFPAGSMICSLFEETFFYLEKGKSTLLSACAGLRIALWLAYVIESARESSQRAITSDIQTVMNMIEKEKNVILTVDQMAKKIGLSKISFQLRFKKQVGVAPHDYIMDHKIAGALELLRSSRESITDVAYKLGFCNSQYFSTVFKRYIGMTPQAYRKQKAMPRRRYPPDERVILADRR